ncbi:uncharacterized protein At2g29880-like [Asparagus officinalis]|uniref:uncharacterized protein At2g29880-like n=1 Tax=Asparagus officinalis TaxID=4686 RepID=UPI00098DF810|nr:uncharacterized protein At2g29880-like [Asparagus officinalis]
MEDELLRLLVEEAKNGNRKRNATFKKHIIQQNVIPVLEAKFSCQFKYEYVYNKWKNWRRRLEPVETIMKTNSGFHWDPLTQKLTCAEETWQNILQANPNTPHLKGKVFEKFEDYKMVVGNDGVSGRRAVASSAQGVDDARSEDSKEEGDLRDDMVRGPGVSADKHEDLSSPTSTESPRPSPTESIPSVTNGDGRPIIPSTTSHDIMLREIANQLQDVNKNLKELVMELRMKRCGNLPWVEAVTNMPGFRNVEKWKILGDNNINQDLKDYFVMLDEEQRRRFMNWMLSRFY